MKTHAPSGRRIREMTQLEKDAFVAYQLGMTYGQFKAMHPEGVTDKEVRHGLEHS